jgi:hypothetical protein
MADADANLEALVRAATAAAEARGHRLRTWTSARDEEGLAFASTCHRCGEALYVRRQDGLVGMTGRALAETCDGHVTARRCL